MSSADEYDGDEYDGLVSADERAYAARLKPYGIRLYRTGDGLIQIAGDYVQFGHAVHRDGVQSSPALNNELYYFGCRMSQWAVGELRDKGYKVPDVDPRDPTKWFWSVSTEVLDAYRPLVEEVRAMVSRGEPIPDGPWPVEIIDWDAIAGNCEIRQNEAAEDE